MAIRKRLIVAGAIACISASAGAIALARAIRRRRKRVLKPEIRKLMLELVKLQGDDFVPQRLPGGGLGKSIFFKRIERLDDKQLMVLFAIVEVGYFLKASGIDPLHPTQGQIEQAAHKFTVELAGAPKDRSALLGVLDTTDAHDALKASFTVLALA